MGRIETERLLAVARDGRRAWQLAAEQCQMRGERSQALEFFRGAYERRPDLTEIQSAIRELRGAEFPLIEDPWSWPERTRFSKKRADTSPWQERRSRGSET